MNRENPIEKSGAICGGKDGAGVFFSGRAHKKSGHPVLLDDWERMRDFDEKSQLLYSG
jgi:hypothetical protein